MGWMPTSRTTHSFKLGTDPPNTHTTTASVCPPEPLQRTAWGSSLLGRGYAPVGEPVEPVRGEARAWVAPDVPAPQQLIEKAIAFGSAGIHAYAECRTTDLHIRSGLPQDLPPHVPQHRKGFLAHRPIILRHLGQGCAGSRI